MPVIKELPESERPREKMKMFGAETLSNIELLAILIGTGTKDVSSTELAQRILTLDAEGLTHLSDASIEELAVLPGMGIAKSCQVVAAVELGKRMATTPKKRKIRIAFPDDIAELFMQDMRYLKKEVFKVLMLNVKNEIMLIENVSAGNINTSIIDPRSVFRLAVKKGAASVVLVHNHPSGNPEPSDEDINATHKLQDAGEILGIKVIDHLIIGDGVYTSLKKKKKM